MKTMRERYHNDANFKVLVDMMVGHIQQAHYTPSEMREAAMLASIIYEEFNVNQMRYIEKDIEHSLRTIRERIDRDWRA